MEEVSKDYFVYLPSFKEPHSSKRGKLHSQPFLSGLFLRILDNRLMFFHFTCHSSAKVAILTGAMVI